MKVKHIVLSLLFLVMSYFSYIFIYNLFTLNHEDYILFINTALGIFSLTTTVLLSICLFFSIAAILAINWNKKITLNSISKTIKSIKLN